MEKQQFKAESQRLLDLMINSIYTHKEIFLREIISNASDACDKLCYQALTDDSVGMSRKDFKIELKVDKDNRLITVSDNGIGMDKDEMENNLGTICRSGSLQFKQTLDKDKAADTDIIRQFGDYLGGGSWGNLGGGWGDLGGLGDMFSMSEAFIESLKDFDVWSHIGTYARPVVILHGSKDIIVPVSNSQKAAERYPDAKLHIIEGASHGFNAANLGELGAMMGYTADYDGEVLPIVYQFLNR